MTEQLLRCATCGVTVTRAAASSAGWQMGTADLAGEQDLPDASPIVRCGWCSVVVRAARPGGPHTSAAAAHRSVVVTT